MAAQGPPLARGFSPWTGLLLVLSGTAIWAEEPCPVAANRAVALRDEVELLREEIMQMRREHQRQLGALHARLRAIEDGRATASGAQVQRKKLRSADRIQGTILPAQLLEPDTQQDLPAQQDAAQQLEDIESLLKEAETERQAPAAEMGAGIGARLSALNPNVSVIGDFLGVVSNAPDMFEGGGIPLAGFEEGDVDGFTMREIELLMSAAIDPYADGLVKLAFGEDGAEIEEGYALFHDYPFRDRLPDCLQDVQTKLGIFRMAFGPLNLVDDHDLPTIDRPLAIQRFLGEEGLIRPGVSFSKSLPLSEAVASELVLEFTNGEPVGDEPGTPPFEGIDHPLGLVHYKIFREKEPEEGWEERLRECGRLGLRDGQRTLELGATFTATGSRAPGGGEDLYSLMQGFDLTWQWFDPRPDSYRQYLVQSELFISELDQPGDGVRGDVGTYVLGQVRLNRNWFTGLRLDLTEFPERDGFQFAASPYVSYFLTEFNRLRLQYQYLRQEIEGEGSEDVHSVLLQLVFAFGAHPPEPYYIAQRF